MFSTAGWYAIAKGHLDSSQNIQNINLEPKRVRLPIGSCKVALATEDNNSDISIKGYDHQNMIIVFCEFRGDHFKFGR